MRGVSRSILLTLFVAPLLPAIGCSDRDLRPLTPCTTSGASGNVPIQQLKNVDLVFMVDNSNSMASEQRKLRAEFGEMIYVLTTGDTNHDFDTDDPEDGPPVESLRIAVITSDMGVLGAGNGTASILQNCGSGPANHPAGGGFAQSQFEDSFYGDDGKFQRTGHTVVADAPTVPAIVAVNCDVDGTPGDDTVPPAGVTLPDYLTFAAGGAITDTEFSRRVSCLTNVGVNGCVFEQQLEAMLKAITPSTEVPEGGAFYTAPGDEAARGVGHGDDSFNNPAPGWFRDDSLLALVMVSDEDDCSATTPEMFNFGSTVPPFNEDSANQTTAQTRSQTRCTRFENEGLWPVARYVRGYMARRALSPGAFVFAAITGVPPDLTNEVISLPNRDPIVEGTDNLQEILDDPRMAYRYLAAGSVPDATIAYACEHFDTTLTTILHGTASNSTTITGVTVGSAPTPANKSATIAADYVAGTVGTVSGAMPTAGKTPIDITMGTTGQVPEVGMTLSGPGIAAGTVITSAYAKGAGYSLTISEATTGGGTTGGAITISPAANGYGPAVGNFIVNATNDGSIARITAVTGAGPYTVTVDRAVTFAPSDDITVRFRDVEAVPARRATRVAQGIVSEPYFSNATIQSICADTFRPAITRIIRLIQINLRGSCLPRSLIRSATNEVNCDVFVTLAPNRSCSEAAFNGAYDPEPFRLVDVAASAGDADNKLEVCTMRQVPVTASDRSTVPAVPPVGHGWFYDDYTAEADTCGLATKYRVSFTEGDEPPQGSRMAFSCAQPVQDGDLALDINSPCSISGPIVGGNPTAVNPGESCVFPSATDGDEFALRYNLLNREFTYATAAGQASRFNCEFDSNTCQIQCETDAQCPGGFVCYDDPNDLDGNQVGMDSFCVNPVCGTD